MENKINEHDIYWDDQRYYQIEKTVRNTVPNFDAAKIFKITDSKYAPLIEQRDEVYAEGNEAGDPSKTDSPLVYKKRKVWYYGEAIAAAVADAKENGGTVLIPAGESKNSDGAYYTGAIRLYSLVNLHIAKGATLRFMRNRTNEYYPVVQTSYEGSDIFNYSPLIFALKQHDLAITGEGTLDGGEDMWNWRPWKKGYWGERHVENHALDNREYAENGILSHDNLTNVPLNERIFTDDGHRPTTVYGLKDGQAVNIPVKKTDKVMMSSFRPHFIEPSYCENVLIQGVKLVNAPFWQVHPANSNNILIDGITIHSNKTKGYEPYGWNNDDGIDPDACNNVIIQNVNVTVSDDGIALKAFRGNDGMLHHNPCQNVIIRNSEFHNERGNSAAISAGSEMSGGVKNIFIENVKFGGPGLVHALKLKTNAYRGGYIKNIYFRNSEMDQVTWGLIQFDSDYNQTLSVPELDVHDPVIKNIFIKNVKTNPNIKHCSPCKSIIDFQSAASRSPVSNIYLKDCTFYTRHSVESAFRKNKFIANLNLDNVVLVNPKTGISTTYNIHPIKLAESPVAMMHNQTAIALLNSSSDTEHPLVNELPAGRFKVLGKLNLTNDPHFVTDGGEIKIYVDRSKRPYQVNINADGSFETKHELKIPAEKYWYRGHHYLAINIIHNDNINTIVYLFKQGMDTNNE